MVAGSARFRSRTTSDFRRSRRAPSQEHLARQPGTSGVGTGCPTTRTAHASLVACPSASLGWCPPITTDPTRLQAPLAACYTTRKFRYLWHGRGALSRTLAMTLNSVPKIVKIRFIISGLIFINRGIRQGSRDCLDFPKSLDFVGIRSTRKVTKGGFLHFVSSLLGRIGRSVGGDAPAATDPLLPLSVPPGSE